MKQNSRNTFQCVNPHSVRTNPKRTRKPLSLNGGRCSNVGSSFKIGRRIAVFTVQHIFFARRCYPNSFFFLLSNFALRTQYFHTTRSRAPSIRVQKTFVQLSRNFFRPSQSDILPAIVYTHTGTYTHTYYGKYGIMYKRFSPPPGAKTRVSNFIPLSPSSVGTSLTVHNI